MADPAADAPVFLVTGASGAIGAATARMARETGYRVVVSGRRRETLETFADDLGGPAWCLALAADVTEWSEVRALAEAVASHFGRLDVAFVNAGISSHTSFLVDTDAHEEWRSMVLTNVYGAAITAKELLPMLAATRGHLVLTGSVAGRVPVPGSLYSATKWAITAMGQSIRSEASGTGIRVTVIEPGLVDTPAISPSRRGEPKLDPADVARAVLFAVTQPPGVDVNEIVVRPVGQSPYR
jgi:NADP-dependent 3-hydroxy acid dehydrogenase YdfG